mmetsp:Transcript_28144/g.74335  ORF Transcript_28144/g.74335 Transcript_28144/m.74335 type:complete len:234 (+) Transcript_28144:143-844(+)
MSTVTSNRGAHRSIKQLSDTICTLLAIGWPSVTQSCCPYTAALNSGQASSSINLSSKVRFWKMRNWETRIVEDCPEVPSATSSDIGEAKYPCSGRPPLWCSFGEHTTAQRYSSDVTETSFPSRNCRLNGLSRNRLSISKPCPMAISNFGRRWSRARVCVTAPDSMMCLGFQGASTVTGAPLPVPIPRSLVMIESISSCSFTSRTRKASFSSGFSNFLTKLSTALTPRPNGMVG